jgi:hypothetical protein
MKRLEGIKAIPSQKFYHTITEGNINFTLNYRPMVQMWFVDIEFNGKIINGLRVCYSLNLLYQYAKTLPFGLYVENISGVEPFLIDDFSSGRFNLNVLTAAEVLEINTAYKDYKLEL